MLFDLSTGKRKRVVQVVYSLLAILFAVSFVGFGIGSDAAGGIFDALGLGSGNSTGNPQFDDEIDEAEAQLDRDPKDEQALEELVRVHYQAGNAALEVDEETGSISFTPEAETEFTDSTEAWERYLKVAKKPSGDVAAIANQAYGVLLQSAAATDVPTIAKEAMPAAEVYAEQNPGVGPYATLAQYAYFAGEVEVGDQATEEALAEAEPSQRKQLEKQLGQTKEAAVKLEKEIAKQAEEGGGEEAFSNPLEDAGATDPLGGLGGLGGTPPVPTPAP